MTLALAKFSVLHQAWILLNSKFLKQKSMTASEASATSPCPHCSLVIAWASSIDLAFLETQKQPTVPISFSGLDFSAIPKGSGTPWA